MVVLQSEPPEDEDVFDSNSSSSQPPSSQMELGYEGKDPDIWIADEIKGRRETSIFFLAYAFRFIYKPHEKHLKNAIRRDELITTSFLLYVKLM